MKLSYSQVDSKKWNISKCNAAHFCPPWKIHFWINDKFEIYFFLNMYLELYTFSQNQCFYLFFWIFEDKSLKLAKILKCLGDAAEIKGIFYSQWDSQMVKISRILKFLTWHGFGEFDWNDPSTNNWSKHNVSKENNFFFLMIY